VPSQHRIFDASFAITVSFVGIETDSTCRLGQQVSHLLLKYTESGYGTVLTAACARQGCSATEWVSKYMSVGRLLEETHTEKYRGAITDVYI
jgi:hypothetical protein